MINLLNKLELDKKKIFLIILACLIILYIDFTFFIKLQLKSIRTLRPKIIKLKQDIGNLTRDLATIQEAKFKQIEVRQKTFLKAKKIISEGEIPALLQDISDIANKHGVKILKMLPSKEVKTKEQNLVLDLSCDYHRFGSFLNDLEKAEKFMAIEEIKITPDASNYLQQRVNLVLRIYIYVKK